jgi:hypothetical protein
MVSTGSCNDKSSEPRFRQPRKTVERTISANNNYAYAA